jgi:citrate lyase subunit beta / citryl-CoA lyase
MVFTAGNHGEGIRSDCFVSLEITSQGGISIDLKSKVDVLYGQSIIELCHKVMVFFDINNARLCLNDQGALPFTLAARLEAAVKLAVNTPKEFLLPVIPQNNYPTTRDKDRITRLYLPGNNPKLMINAGIYGSDGIILDLEDSVPPEKKSEARYLVRNALRSVDFYGAERMVRINQLPVGLNDLGFCVAHGVHLILIPKCESGSEVIAVNRKISGLLGHENKDIHLMPIIESAKGIMSAYEIAASCNNVVAMAIGLEDYTADIGTPRTLDGKETFFARSMVVNAAVAAGIQPIDSVFSEIDNMEAMAINVAESKSLGFVGMGCIHPRQIRIIHEQFLPGEVEISKAKKIVAAFIRAEKEGSAVVALDSKMIDPPVVKRALSIINLAVKSGKIPENWREAYE